MEKEQNDISLEDMAKQNKINYCYFSLVSYLISGCFSKIITINKNREKEIIEDRINFSNSKLVGMFCDCSYNFEFKKLRKNIIEYNKKLIK